MWKSAIDLAFTCIKLESCLFYECKVTDNIQHDSWTGGLRAWARYHKTIYVAETIITNLTHKLQKMQ